MKKRLWLLLKAAGVAVALLLAVGVAAPYFAADQYGKRLQSSLQRALGRQVELGKVHFNLFKGPGFSIDSVTIYEDPAIGLEPIAYVQEPGSMEVVPSIWSLLGGRFVISSIRLDGASLNLVKTGPASEPGRWNFDSFVNRSVMSNPLAIHMRDSRINFKFGDTKSVFYLTETDLDIVPPGATGGGWRVSCSGRPARTDRSAQGLGSFTLKGRWYVAPERVDLDLAMDRAGLGDLTALFRGYAGSVHGTVTSRLHLGGPINNIGIQGRVTVEDVHRWDLLPPQGQGWPMDVRGRLDLLGQQLELQASSSGDATPPVSAYLRTSDYLTQPHWAVAVNWNRFPVQPLMQLAADMGAQFPPKLKVTGTMDGAIGYSGRGSFQGELAFHDASVAIPDSPPVRFDQAYLVLDHGHVRLSPALVNTAEQDQAQVEADYAIDEDTLDLAIHTEAMKVASLRAQVALAAVPWLEQVQSGQWTGDLHYHRAPDAAGWSGELQLSNAEIPVAGLADPVQLASVHAHIDGDRLVLENMNATAGKLAFTGEYRYDPRAARPHKLRLQADAVDAADLETELMPTLRRPNSLLARALGRTSLPDWMRTRGVEGTVQVGDLALGGWHFEDMRTRLLWDAARVELDNMQARLDRAPVRGRMTISLRGTRPAYRLAANVKGLVWQSGKLDAEGTLQSTGTGAQLLANLTSEGTFTGTALDFGMVTPWHTVTGTYSLACSPRLRFKGLNLKAEDETYTGRGGTQEDGRMLILLSNGTREMRMTGTLTKLRVEETLRP